MKVKKFIPVSRGIAAAMASILVISSLAYPIAKVNSSQIDNILGTKSYEIVNDSTKAKYQSDYSSAADFHAAIKAHAIQQGEEGFVLMKNDNSALPMTKSGQKVALFGAAAYMPYMGNRDLHAGNDDEVDLVGALEAAGFEINATMKGIYETILSKKTETAGAWGQKSVSYTYAYKSSPGDWTDFQINEVPADKYTDTEIGNAAAGWKSSISKSDTIGICVFARGAGEGNMYKPGSAVNFAGEKTGKDPLALSEDELSVVDAAKETCSKVIVLINSGNAMELGAIANGGAHEVDAIGYIGIPNDYHFTGIVNVLSGKANASGALSDTYVNNNLSAPATVNLGGDEYSDADIASSDGTDPRWPGVQISNSMVGSFGGSSASYGGGSYIVEAEGIYVGYKYYETRYYDSIMDSTGTKAKSNKGATDGSGWDYNEEVTYTFGHGLSYYDYEQELTSVKVDDSNYEGNIEATVKITNKSSTKAKFTAQLYVESPYTEYDKTNKVEKSAVAFLNSAKVEVDANSSKEVTITVPTKYLASYDSNNAKTYILDNGTYYFTAAAGAHEAVNNILAKHGKTTADGMDAEGNASEVKEWVKGGSTVDATSFSKNSTGTKIENVADNADLNYWLPGTVTYLSRSDWEATYPINYNTEKTVTLANSSKKDEWIKEIRGQQYTIDNTGAEALNVNGRDYGEKYNLNATNTSAEFAAALNDIDNDLWDVMVNQISVDEAVGAVIHGGSQSDVLTNVDNPIVKQNEGVNGYTADYKDEATGKTYCWNLSSQTLLATSFNPDLAYEWGKLEGTSGLYLKTYDVWGTGLTQRRTVYNGRNYEYISEDSMLANRIGYGILKGAAEKGTMCGPKHIGANDQEHNRAGIAEYMTEQKLREGDLRCFQGGLEDADGLAVMVAFNRIGATNASHHSGMLLGILRGEWNYNGLISTDMMNNKYYFNAESMVMAGITQVADFAQNNSHIMGRDGTGTQDSNWTYISVANVKNDATLVNQARQNLKYQLYAFAHSGVIDIQTVKVTPWWESALQAVVGISAALFGISAVAWIGCTVLSKIKKEDEE